jgi:hypothetical protein
VGEARAPGEQGSLTAEATGRGWRLASPATAVALGALGLALMAVWVSLTYLTGDVQVSPDGAALALALVCGFVGMLVARRQPRNPEGWLLLGAAVCVVALLDSGLYAVLDYHLHHGRLPLGKPAVFVRDSLGAPWISQRD